MEGKIDLPFIARMMHLAMQRPGRPQDIDLVPATTDHQDDAMARLTADAQASGVRRHVPIAARDRLPAGTGCVHGARLAGGRHLVLRPAGFGRALRDDPN